MLTNNLIITDAVSFIKNIILHYYYSHHAGQNVTMCLAKSKNGSELFPWKVGL